MWIKDPGDQKRPDPTGSGSGSATLGTTILLLPPSLGVVWWSVLEEIENYWTQVQNVALVEGINLL